MVTVDDFLVITNNPPLRDKAKLHIQTKYKLKDLGPVTHILGWKVTRDTTGIKLSQPAYIKTLLSKYGLQDAKTAPSPIASEILNTPEHATKALDTKKYDYHGIIGSIRYLADSTRPDISFIIGFLGRHAHKPTTAHWQAALRVLRYLNATQDQGLHYKTGLHSTLQAHSDSDYAACVTTRRSTSGTYILYNDSPVAWQSKRQRFIATSTWAAEYVAAFHTAQHIICLRNLLADLNHAETKPTPLRMDNVGAITTANTTHPTPKSKHIDVKYHYIKELIDRKEISISYIPSSENCADILTKAFKPAQYKERLPLLRLS